MLPELVSSNSDGFFLPGSWKVAAGRALTLRPRHAGTLKVVHGSLWLTFDSPHAAHAGDSGDIVIELGDGVPIDGGKRVVVESFRPRAASYFAWEPLQ